MTMIAYAFFQSRRLAAAERKKAVGPLPQPIMPAVGQAILDFLRKPADPTATIAPCL